MEKELAKQVESHISKTLIALLAGEGTEQQESNVDVSNRDEELDVGGHDQKHQPRSVAKVVYCANPEELLREFW